MKNPILTSFVIGLLIGIVYACAPARAGTITGGGSSGGVAVGLFQPPLEVGFTEFSESSYGSGAALAEDNLTSRMPIWTPIEPPDVTAWTINADVTTCDGSTVSAIQTEIDSICGTSINENTRLRLPNCTIAAEKDYAGNESGGSGVSNGASIWTIPADCDGLYIEAQANTIIALAPDDPSSWYNLPKANINTPIFQGTGGISSIDECNWVGGFGLNERVIEVNPACTDGTLVTSGTNAWSPGSVIALVIADYSNASSGSSSHILFYRIDCIDGPAGGDKLGSDCSLVSGDNTGGNTRIQLDWPLDIDYSPSAGPYAFTVSGHQVQLQERRGSGDNDTNQLIENVWFDGLTVTNTEAPFVNDAYVGGFRFQECFECGVINSDIDRMATQVTLADSVPGADAVGRFLVAHNTLTGPSHKANCIAQITSIGASGSNIVVNFESSPAAESHVCASSGTGDSVVYISSAASEGALQNKLFRYTARPGGTPTNSVTLSSTQITTADCDTPGSCATGGGGYISILDDYGSASIFSNGAADVQIIDNVFECNRGWFVMQNGTNRNVIAYNYADDDSECHWWRGPFSHGDGNGSSRLFEGNDVFGITFRATSTQAPGEGIYNTFLFNRLKGGGTSGSAFYGTGSYGDFWPRGLLECNENASLSGQGSATTEYTHLIGNSWNDVCDSGTNSGIDWWNNAAGGQPGQWHLYASKNLWYGSSAEDSFRSDNTTTLNRDSKDVGGGLNVYGVSAEADEAVVAPSAWDEWSFPSSLYYNTAASRANFVDGKPPWACAENSTFGRWIGAHVDDMTGGGAATNEKLPAQLRYEGGCTPLVP